MNKAATTKIHQCLVRKTRIKRTINEALNPVERGEITLRRPGATQLVSIPKEVSSIFSSTLLTLGGSLEYAPPSTVVDRLLTHSPSCPEPTKHSPLPDITWESFRNTLKGSKPNKAGGRDFRNNYTLHTPPPLSNNSFGGYVTTTSTSRCPINGSKPTLSCFLRKGTCRTL